MIRNLKIIALLLPILIPSLWAAKIGYDRASAPIYKVAIDGYDPRDLLYGHYLMFRYDVENSRKKETFPEDMDEIVEKLPMEYYLDERHALNAEELLRDGKSKVEIGVGIPKTGGAFIEDLYIDDQRFSDYLRTPRP